MKLKMMLIFCMGLYTINAEDVNDEAKIIDTSSAFYGDFSSNDLHVINLDKMKVTQTLVGGFGAYGAEPVGHKYIISLTRKDTSVDVVKVDSKKKSIVHTVELGYQPREVSSSPSKKYTVVSGRDIAAHTVFNSETGTVINHYNRDYKKVKITDFGGQNATGHPFFVNETQYLVLDRAHKEIRLYDVNLGLQDTLKTKTTVHHTLRKGKYLYIAMEGSGSSKKSISPGILKLKIKGEKIVKKSIVYIEKHPELFSGKKSLGIHHINFHYDGKHIYTGSNNGLVYVIDSKSMKVVDSFKSGKGGGHTDFSPKNERAIITNHKSTFITLVDVSNPHNNKIIKNIRVAHQVKGATLQGHTQAFSDDENYFYGAATHDGKLFKIDVKNAHVLRKLKLNGAILEQGSMYQSPEGGFANKKPKFSNNSVKIEGLRIKRVLREKRGGVNLRYWSETPSKGWDIRVRFNKVINLINRKSNRCLTSKRGRIVTRECKNRSKSQMWEIVSVDQSENIYNIRSYKSGKCLSNKHRLNMLECSNDNWRVQWKINSILSPNSILNSNIVKQ